MAEERPATTRGNWASEGRKLNILGISGLENAVPFKRAHWPGLEPREYRIVQGQNSAAALIRDGEIVAAGAEERFSGKKHTGDFPVGAISWCLSEHGMQAGDIDEIAHGFDRRPYREMYSLDPILARLYHEVHSREALLVQIQHHLPGFPQERVQHVNHHLAHAASAYFTSGWDECLVVVMDAMGDVESMSAYQGRNGQLAKLREIPATDSVGILYSLLTLHLGFDFNLDEYKIMGLAPYGDPARFRPFFEEAVELRGGGLLRIPMLGLNRSRNERENYTLTRKYLNVRLIRGRKPEEEITQDHLDVAAALQECLERAAFHVCGSLAAQTGMRKLALAGGVALNCAVTRRLASSGLFDEVYVQPAAGDDGAALGAALYRASLAGEARNSRMPPPLLGPAYSAPAIDAALAEFGSNIETVRFGTTAQACAETASRIAEGKVVAWYRGRMEFGPHALGNRSILADPGNSRMRDRINTMMKTREAYLPFPSAVSAEQAEVWLEIDSAARLPYGTAVAKVRGEHRAKLPAITQVDGWARVLTVSNTDNPDFHQLLRAVGARTGREMVLNASFNVGGRPIVNTPRDAVETFLETGIDYLFLGNSLVTRRARGRHENAAPARDDERESVETAL